MENKKEKILAAAEAEFIQNGFAGARTVAIARRAGVTHAMLHYYFKTKEQLFNEIIMGKVTQLQTNVLSQFETDGISITDRIIKAAQSHFRFLQENSEIPRFILFTLPQTQLSTMISTLGTQFMSRLDKVQQMLDKAEENGEIRKIDAKMLVMTILSLNLAPFMAENLFHTIADITPGFDYNAFLQKRFQANTDIIRRMLEK